jgi:hypothetical protein
MKKKLFGSVLQHVWCNNAPSDRVCLPYQVYLFGTLCSPQCMVSCYTFWHPLTLYVSFLIPAILFRRYTCLLPIVGYWCCTDLLRRRCCMRLDANDNRTPVLLYGRVLKWPIPPALICGYFRHYQMAYRIIYDPRLLPAHKRSTL